MIKGYYLSSEDIVRMSGLDKAHFLNPNAQRNNKSLGDETGLTGIGFHIIDVQPGHETTEHHSHNFEDECVYILSGNATAFIGDNSIPVKAGDFLGYRKGGESHSIINTGDKVLRCIVVGERLDHDVADFPRLKKRVYRNAGLSHNLVDYDAIQRPVLGAKK